MSAAVVTFHTLDHEPATAGREQRFEFRCPLRNRRCGGGVIAGKTNLKRDGQNRDGGVAQWDWNNDRERPTFSPSIDCSGCWHGYIENGRCVSVHRVDEPERA